MRTLYLAESFWPCIGGVEVMAADVLPRLHDRGHDIVVVTDRPDESFPAEDAFKGIPVHRLAFNRAVRERDLEGFAEARQATIDIIRRHQPDLIHAVFIGPGVWLLPTIDDIPVLVSLHGNWPTIDWAAADGFAPRVLERAAWITACSEAALADVVRAVPHLADRASVIYNGLDPVEPSPPPPPPDGPPVLLCSARATHDKGLDIAVDVLARIPNARLVVAGNGPVLPGLREQARALGVSDRVDFPGWVAPRALAEMRATSAVVLVPSRLEGFGLVALEAALSERPVVATRVGGLPEVVIDGETGLLVPPDDAPAMAAAVRRLLEQPELAEQLGRAGRERALARFDGVRHADDWDALYNRIGAKEAVH